MNLEHGIQQIKNNLENSYIFTKYSVEDDEQSERPRVIVKLWCMNLVNESSELTKVLRMIRKRIPTIYMVKTKIYFNM